MKKLWNRMVSVGLVLTLLLALCPLPRALAADLSGAEVTVAGGNLVYNGQEQEPEVTVTLEGKTLTEGIDYSLSYDDNVNAGSALAIITGMGDYTGGTVTKIFTIRPYLLTEDDFSNLKPLEKVFNRKDTETVELSTTIYGDTIKLKGNATYSQKGAGPCTVLVEGLSVLGGNGNYILDESFRTLNLQGEIYPLQTKIRNGTVGVGETIDLWSLVEDAGPIGKEGGPVASFDIVAPADKLGCAEPTPENLLSAGDRAGVLTLSADISEAYWGADNVPDYTGITTTFTITITKPQQEEQPPVVDPTPAPNPDPAPTPDPVPPATQKQPQEALVINGAKDIFYGETLRLSCSGGSTNGKVTWGIAKFTASGEATISPSGLLTPVKAGDIWVTATMAGNDTYKEIAANAVKMTIRQAPITITVGSKSALMGDAVPALTAADYTVTGLVGNDKLAVLPTLSYGTTPDMTREGEVAILASGASVPVGGNYAPNITYVPGKLIIGAAYPITINQAEGGTVTSDVSQASEGTRVTLTIRPQEGYVLESLNVVSGSDVIETTQAGEGKVTFAMPAGGVLITPVFAEELPQELPFTDVREGDWFYDSVAYVYANGLMNGTSATAFTPNGTTTRGMIVTILYRLAGSPEAAAWSPFQDVAPDQYYAVPIAWAAWNGIVNGKTATTFGPNDPITREQMAAILYRYAKDQGMDVSLAGNLSQFSDQGKISSYAREALAWANGAGLITGKGKGILDPKGPAVRAQVAAIFQRFCENTSQ